MKAWRFYNFGDMRLEDISIPKVRPGWVLAKVLTLQPSITEVQASRGIRIGGIEKVEKVLKERAPLQLFGHEFCVGVSVSYGDTQIDEQAFWDLGDNSAIYFYFCF